jgi:hypothetical protein
MGWVVKVTDRSIYPRGKKRGKYFTGSWMGPKCGIAGCGKFYPPPGFDPRTVIPVMSPYTDWTGAVTHPQDSNVKQNKASVYLVVMLLPVEKFV